MDSGDGAIGGILQVTSERRDFGGNFGGQREDLEKRVRLQRLEDIFQLQVQKASTDEDRDFE